MNFQFVKGALVAVALVLLGSTPARAADYAPFPNGSVLIDSSTNGRWLIQGGARFMISVDEVPYFKNPFFTFTVAPSVIAAITTIPRDGTTLQQRGDASIYVVVGGRAWGIPDMNELEHFGGTSGVRIIPWKSLHAFPLYFARDGTMVRERSGAPVYVIFGNGKFWVPTSADVEYYGGWDNVQVIPDGSAATMDDAPSCGSRLRERSSGLIYLINNIAEKTLIVNPSSYDWANHYVVPDGTLARFPDGVFFCIG
ncbi:hypothetical protein F0U61_12600 [Archangium violaceum]|uniref:hypothetical protein n=1 Tax=Archangium violaceum TaxID=83451 RepID=UPI002B2F699B|nr:hypothetical protein F0U61_12600 [Archangium violaceum]